MNVLLLLTYSAQLPNIHTLSPTIDSPRQEPGTSFVFEEAILNHWAKNMGHASIVLHEQEMKVP